MQGKSSGDKSVSCGVVRSNKRLQERFYRLELEFRGDAGAAFAKSRPGQFAQMDLSAAALPASESIPEDLSDGATRDILLRRPFSFCDVAVKDDVTMVGILYCVTGPATVRMTTLSAGDSVSVIGPLGNGFWLPEGKQQAVLIAGGMGAAPLEHLAKFLTDEYAEVDAIAFVGAKTAKELPFEKRLDEISQGIGFSLMEFARYGIQSRVATNDGSAAFKGTVTDCFLQWLEKTRYKKEDMIIFGCGPEAMLAKVAEIARKENIDCQVCMERRMACGFGVCQSCAVECKVEGSSETVYKLCCKDGPVFDTQEVVF